MEIRRSPAPETSGPLYRDVYPVRLSDGSTLELPIQALPGGEQAIALLMSNQTPFEVENALAALLAETAKALNPDIVVGIPTLGLDYARLVARGLGHADYVALGNSRKFWYNDDLSVAVHSVTSPGANKRLYIDPKMVERVAGKRTLIIDDVINTGGSAAAAIELLQRAGANLIGLEVVLIEGEAWKPVLAALGAAWPGRVTGLGRIPIFQRETGGWRPIP